MERRVKWRELDEGEIRWHNLEKESGFEKLKSKVSAHLQVVLLMKSLSSWFNRSSVFVSPTRKWCETKVGPDKHWVMHGMHRIGTICVVFHVKWQRLRCGWRRKSQKIEKERDFLVKNCCGKNSRNWIEEIRRNIWWHWSSWTKWRLS